MRWRVECVTAGDDRAGGVPAGSRRHRARRMRLLRLALVTLLSLVGSGALLFAPSAVPGGAGARRVLAAGTLTETVTQAATISATLTGLDQTVSAPLVVSVTNTGSSAAWDVEVTATPFTTSAGQTLPANASSITGFSVICTVAPCTNPVNPIVYPVPVPAQNPAPAAVSCFYANANTGTGTFDLTATLAVLIPGNAYAGSYTSTLTFSIFAGLVPPGTTVLAINSGGSAAGSFSADADYSGGSTYKSGTAVNTSGLTNPAPQAVYQSERYGNLTYTAPGLTPNAAYTVRLHFAEIYWTASGKRVFNVSINGTQVLSNFDIFATAGGEYKAVIEQFTATANSSGAIVIQYTTIKDNAKSSGIEIITG